MALMGLLPSEYKREMEELWVDVSPGCPIPTVSLMLWFLMEDRQVGVVMVGRGVSGLSTNFYPPTRLPVSSLAHSTAFSWDPKIAKIESPPMVQPTGAHPHSCFQQGPEDA